MKQKVTIFILLLFSINAFAQLPSANFSANVTAGCAPIIIDFQDLSTGNPTSWSWDFGNGGISNLKNPSTSYFNPGQYTVTLTVTNGNGSHTTTKTAFITVYNLPTVDFNATKRTGCSPAVIDFNDLSTSPAGMQVASWKWSFGDGGTSTLKNPTYAYRTPGSYSVSLTITTDKGCTKTITKPYYVDVTPGVMPEFSYVDPGDCSAPSTITFQNTSVGPGTLSYFWNLGNGNTSTSQNPTTTYNTNGTYRVSLIVVSSMGCTDSLVRNIVIGKANTDFAIPASVCPKTTVQFTNTSDPRPISSLWQFSNGTTDTFRNGQTIFDAPGNYTVTLINTYTACTDTLVKTITVSNSPNLSFNASDTGKCQAPFTVNFNNTTNGVSYIWNFGDGNSSTQTNPSHTYTTAGSFDVTLIATGANGCRDTLKKAQYIQIKKPVISFKDLPAEGCIPHKVDFESIIKTVDDVVSYSWNFGNGNTSTQKTPSHTYTQQGNYNVTLTITTKGGCTETFTMPEAVKVGTKPKAGFTSNTTSACADPGIQFTNQSTGATKYLWQFSDGSSSTAENPLHKFIDTGSIDVILIANNNGCKDSLIKNDYAYINPSISKFDYRPNCDNRLEITFTDKSVLATTWEWNFGDGTTFTGQNPPPHIYPSMGSYDVSLKTTNGSCTYTLVRTITIADYTPDFTTTVTEGCKPFTATITPSSPNPGSIKNYVWHFGEGDSINFGQGSYGEYTYTKTGSYNVGLSTIDTFGCKFSITKNNFIKAGGPTAKFGSTSNAGCKGLTTTFFDSSLTDGTSSIVQWTWDFGDSTVKTFTTAQTSYDHTYDSVGDYDVKLVVVDSRGCTDSVTYRAFVKISTLKVDWETSGATCPGAPISFSNLTKSDLPFTSVWDFGDGSNSTDLNPSHIYASVGVYSVSLKVKDLIGCEDSLYKEDIVEVNVPKASFDANNFTSYCSPFEAIFTNTSEFYSGSLWDLSVGTTTQANPSIYYTNIGSYPVKLVVTSPGGCKDSVTHTVNVYDANNATLSYSPLSGCRPTSVDLTAFSPLNGRFIWDMGDGNVIDTTINSISHIYDNFGSFTPKIILKQPDGCIVPLVGANTIEIYGAKAKFDLVQKLFCDSGYITILDSTTSRDNIIKYNWNFGDGNSSSLAVPIHQYTSPGNYTITLDIETENGCKDTMVLQPPVKVVQSPLISLNGPDESCVNERAIHSGVFDRTDTSAVRWLWQMPNGNSYDLQNPPPQFYTIGDHTITLISTNSSGCADTATKNIRIHALPEITLPAQLTKVVGLPVTLPAEYTSGVISYSWAPANTLDCSNCPQPIATPKFTTKYTVNVVDSNNCKNTSQIEVRVVCEGATIFLPNTFSPNGDGVNDVFYPRGVGLDRVKSLRVFNRWGQVVFEQKDFPVNNQMYGWNGMHKGMKAIPDVYIYQVEIFCENSEILRFEGNVALIQ